jgi:DNA-directed RNA polymerase I, II, and III subunit RPABC1
MDLMKDKKDMYKVRQTILEMIEDRGFHVVDMEKISFEQFSIKYDNKNIHIYTNDTVKNKSFYVYFYNDNKSLSKNDFKNIIQKIFEEYGDENMTILLILKEKENNSITKELSKDFYKNIEIFLKKNMIFNVTKHCYVPKHILLKEEEVIEVLEKYFTTKNKLPKLLKTDPIAKYYGMKYDDVCKIIRKSPEVGEYIYYRVVK